MVLMRRWSHDPLITYTHTQSLRNGVHFSSEIYIRMRALNAYGLTAMTD